MIVQVLVPAGWAEPGSVRATVYGRMQHPEDVFEARSEDLLPQRVAATYLGASETPPTILDVPDHTEAIRHILTERGWFGTRFDVFRCSVQYPVLHTMIRLSVDAKQP